MRLAAIKYKMNHGKIFFKLNEEVLLVSFETSELANAFFALLALYNARTRVIGIIARVRVSFTVTALSRVSEPRFHIASQVEAQAVTEDVSFTAVPAKIPKASPFVVENPTI